MIRLFLANGFEEIEALATVDVLRRCGLSVNTVSINPSREVMGAHGIPVLADTTFEDSSFADEDALILPGGMPGASNLLQHEGLRNLLLTQNTQGGLIAAICAAPMVLGQHGILVGHKATCYPGFEGQLTGATTLSDLVVEDGNVITGKGPAAAVPFGFAIAGRFVSVERIEKERKAMMY